MGSFTLGALSSLPASQRPDLLGPPTLAALERQGLLDQVGVVEIDPAISDTAATQGPSGSTLDMLANCVVVGGQAGGDRAARRVRRPVDHPGRCERRRTALPRCT